MRFGVPQEMVTLISNVYSQHTFVVRDGERRSQQRGQESGISQGCPLSPFLFVMVMSIVMRDSIHQLTPGEQAMFQRADAATVLYADDTLLPSVEETTLSRLLAVVAETGSRYGLALHWDMFQLLNVRRRFAVAKPDGQSIEASS